MLELICVKGESGKLAVTAKLIPQAGSFTYPTSTAGMFTGIKNGFLYMVTLDGLVYRAALSALATTPTTLIWELYDGATGRTGYRGVTTGNVIQYPDAYDQFALFSSVTSAKSEIGLSYYNVTTKTLGKYVLSSLPSGNTNLDGGMQVLINDKLYLFGGRYGNAVNNAMVVYTTSAKATTAAAAVLVSDGTVGAGSPALTAYGCVAAIGTDIYMFGGELSNSNSSLITVKTLSYKYNTVTHTWSAIKPLPSPVRTAATIAVGKYIYIVGGLATPAAVGSNLVIRYNTGTDTYDTVPSPDMIVNAYGGKLFAMAGKIYLFGGTVNGVAASKDLYELTV